MCFHRNYKIYYSKRKSLRAVQNWHLLGSDKYHRAQPILLTVNVPLSIVVELANRYGAYFTTNTTILDPDSGVILELYSKDMAEELVKRGSKVVVVKK